MYYALKTDCYFRHYGSVGHLIRPITDTEMVLNDSGALFVEQLDYIPHSLEEIVNKLINYYNDADKAALFNDAEELFDMLVKDGFLDSAESKQSFNPSSFNYSTLSGKTSIKAIKSQLEEPSSHYLREYFKNAPFLESFHIELISKCNERCVHCYIPHENKTTEINPDLMMSVLAQCKEMGVLTVVFSGGEPMLHRNFCDFLRQAKDYDLNVTVLSNLTLLNEQIVQALKYRHASCVNVSLYSMDPDVHDSVTTVKGSFYKTRDNIIKLIENNIPVQINCPVMKQNKDSFDGVIKWGQDHKCSVVTDYLIMARCDRTTDNLENRLTEEDLQSVISRYISADIIAQSRLQMGHTVKEKLLLNPDESVCGVAMSTLCMVANGDCYPCAGWQKYVCGNLQNTKLEEIWKNSPALERLRRLRQKDFKQCLQCADYDYCHMCIARNSNEDPNGDYFNIPEITCQAAHIQHQTIIEHLSKIG